MSEEFQTSEQLAALVEADRQRRIEEFRRIIEEAAAQLRVMLLPVVTITPQGISTDIRVVDSRSGQ